MTHSPVFIIAEQVLTITAIFSAHASSCMLRRKPELTRSNFKLSIPKTGDKKCEKAHIRKKILRPGSIQFEMLASLTLSEDQHASLKEEANKLGIQFLSTPFERRKPCVSSYPRYRQNQDWFRGYYSRHLLPKAARSGKDIILSTGMSITAILEQHFQ